MDIITKILGVIIERVINLPTEVEAILTIDAEGDYNIYINAKLPRNKQIQAAQHELEHIQKDHIYNEIMTVQNLENEVIKRLERR